MMEMLVTLYVPRTAPLAAALEGKAAQGTQRDVRGGLPGTPCAVCGEQGCGQKDVHAEARADCAEWPAGNESARGALGRADEGACGMRNGIHAETKASRAERPAGNESARGALGRADEEACGMRNGVHTEAQGESRTQAACGEETLPGAGQAARRAAHGTCGMPLQEKLDAVDEYCTGDSLYTVAASHGIALAAAHRLTASRTLLQENERRRRRLIELVCGARPPVRPVCRGCVWGCRATGLCTQPRCLKEEGPRG